MARKKYSFYIDESQADALKAVKERDGVLESEQINLSQVFAGQKVGVKQTAEHIWLVTFMDYDLGFFDDETCRLEPIDDPFGPRLSPMSPE